MKKNHYWELDVLRFIAAFAVMNLHYVISGGAAGSSPYSFPGVPPAPAYFYLAVDFFFMISGFVILLSTEKMSRDGAGGWQFFKSRVLRLYPAYWVACTITFLFVRNVYPDLVTLSSARYLLNMTMLNGFFNIGCIDGAYWTLFVELRFYILIGALLVMNQLRHIELYMAGWLVIAAGNYFGASSLVEYVLFTKYCGSFIAGCTFYLIRSRGMTGLRLAILAGSLLVSYAYGLQTLAEKAQHYRVPLSPLVLLGCLLVFYAVFSLIGRASAPRHTTVITALGGMSYPLYLLHSNIGFSIFNVAPASIPPFVVVGLTMAAMCLAAYVMWRYVEPAVRNKLRGALGALESRVRPASA